MFDFANTKKSQNNLVVSVESSHIRACLVSSGQDGKPYIISQEITRFNSEGSDYNTYKQRMIRALGDALVRLQKGLAEVPQTTHCILGSPWYIARTHTYTKEEDMEFRFDSREAEEVLKKESKDFVTHVTEDYFSGRETTVIEKKLINLAINEYTVSEIPKGQHVKKVSVSSYVSVALSDIVSDIEENINRYFYGDVRFSSSNLASFIVCRDIFSMHNDFSLLFVSGSQTEISVVREDVLESLGSFAIGSNILESISKEQGLHHNSVVSMMAIDEKGKLHNDIDDSSKDAVLRAEEKWRSQFFNWVRNIHNQFLPDTIIVIAQKDTRTWIQKAIKDPRNTVLSTSQNGFHDILLSESHISTHVGSAIDYPDINLLIFSLFSTLMNNNHVTK